jgi:hypothetical protein
LSRGCRKVGGADGRLLAAIVAAGGVAVAIGLLLLAGRQSVLEIRPATHPDREGNEQLVVAELSLPLVEGASGRVSVAEEAIAPSIAISEGESLVHGFTVTVLDRLTGTPVQGALLNLDVLSGAMLESNAAGSVHIQCDIIRKHQADQIFSEYECDILQGSAGSVQADGYGLAMVNLPGMDARVELDREAFIMFAAAGGDAAPAEGVELRVTFKGSDILWGESGVGGETFALGRSLSFKYDAKTNQHRSLGGVGHYDVVGITEVDGVCVLAGLPAGVPLTLLVSSKSRQFSLQSMRLSPGEVGLVEWREPEGYQVRGRMRGVRGEPLGGLEVCAVRGQRGWGDPHILQGDEVIFASAETNDLGFFQFDLLPEGVWFLAPKGSLAWQRRGGPASRPVCLARKAVVPSDTQDEVNLSFANGEYLQGKVYTRGGSPADAARVVARPKWCSGSTYAICNTWGEYRLGPIPLGEYSVQVETVTGRGPDVEWIVAGAGPHELDLQAGE